MSLAHVLCWGSWKVGILQKVACLVSLFSKTDMPRVRYLIWFERRWCLWHPLKKDPTANCSLDKNLTGLTPVKKDAA